MRVHSGPTAAAAATAVGARAFALGSHVVLGGGERSTDLALMAHEVAHVVQQQGAPRVQLWSRDGGDSHEREAHQASTAVVSARRFSVLGRTSARVQRWGISDVLDWFADKANLIPGYRMFTIVIGLNPINMSRVERSAANILRAIVELIPGGGLITRALDAYGVFERAGTWVEQQIRTLGMTGGMFRDALMRFLDSLGWRDILRPGSVWDRAKRIFTEPISRLIDFGKSLVDGIVTLIKDAILRPLAQLASRTRGWDLLRAVLGRDPITGDPYPRTAETLIGGFMKLIGQEEVWNNLKQARAVSRAWAWFQGAVGGLMGFVTQIPSLFLSALRSLEIADIVILPNAFIKVGRAFAGFAGQFFSWAGQQVLSLLQIIFEVLAPAAMPYLRKAAGAFTQIVRNPVGFIGNLVRAGIQGFRQFSGNFLNHLRRSLIQWLTGTLSGTGIYIPQAFELREVVKFVLSVLGLTWQNIRGKLLRLIPEPALRALETGFDLVVTLVRDGPAAAWEQIREQLSNLREMVMEQIMSFVRTNIVTAAITRLVSSLNPAGAFVQAVVAIYNTVMFFVERLRQIAQVAASFIDSISAIAAGGIGTAANRVEQTMGGLLTLVISFLARLVGLGRVSDEVARIVNRIRAPIDRALDRVADWIVGLARRAGGAIMRGARSVAGRIAQWWRMRKAFSAQDGSSHALYFSGEGQSAVLTVATGTPVPVNTFLRTVASVATASSADPGVRAAYQAAVARARVIDGLRATVERDDATGRQTAAVDQLNREMELLVPLLAPLIPLAFPAPAAGPGSMPVALGELIKLLGSNLVAKVSGFIASGAPGQQLIQFRVVNPRQERSRATLPTGFLPSSFGREFTKYTEDPRELYLGRTPRKSSNTGKTVRDRMTREGKLVNGKVLYARDGKWYSISECDMGHVIDAVTWWNSNGRLTGAQSPAVCSFMTNPINYEFEPSGPNQARGAALAARGIRYLPPEV